MSNWKVFRLGEVADIITGFPFKGNKYSTNGIRVLRGENVTIGDLRWDTIKCWDEEFDQFEKYSLREGDIVIGMDGSRVGKNRAQIRNTDLPLLLAQRVACVRAKQGYSQDLIAYLIKSPKFEQYVSLVQTGTSIPHISQKQIADYELKLTEDLSTQNAIAEILSSLDDKIELNNQINKNLEALAQALFKQWFVDFEFPNENNQPYKSSGGEMVESELGEIPKGWTVCKLSSLIEITGGGTPKRANEEYWNGNIPWFSIQDIPNESQAIVIDTLEKITELGLNNSSTKILSKGTTIITARGTVGKLAFVSTPMAMNQSCYGITGKNGIGPYFNYYNLKHAVKTLQQNTHGAVFDTITTSTFDTVLIAFGDISLALRFDESVKSSFGQIEANIRENDNLTKLREVLLPKLINGELEISK